MSDDLLTAEELARLLGVRPGTIRRWARERIIPHIRVSPKVQRFCYVDVRSAIQKRSAEFQQAEATKGGGHDN